MPWGGKGPPCISLEGRVSQKRGMVSLSLWRISSLLIVCGCEAVSCQRGVGVGGGGGVADVALNSLLMASLSLKLSLSCKI